jgi:hypothetical protein
MIRRLAAMAVAAAAAAVMLAPQPAAAVVNGTIDDSGAYPYVGTLVIEVPSADGPSTYHYWCSGTMVSARVFVAAGHCFDPGTMEWFFGAGTRLVGLTLNANVNGFMPTAPSPTYHGMGIQVPGWPGKSWSLDVGAYTLDGAGVPGLPALPSLPSVRQLDGLGLTGSSATIVGYGLDRSPTRGPNGTFNWDGDGVRTYASERITGVDPTRLHLLGAIAAGGSGPCGGDSGAPRFVDVAGTRVLAAITGRIGPNCETPEEALRLDNPSIASFLWGLLGG